MTFIHSEIDTQMAQTFDHLNNDKTVSVFFPDDPMKPPEFYRDKDGAVKKAAFCFSINGLPYNVPANERVDVPETIFNLIQEKIENDLTARDPQRVRLDVQKANAFVGNYHFFGGH